MRQFTERYGNNGGTIVGRILGISIHVFIMI